MRWAFTWAHAEQSRPSPGCGWAPSNQFKALRAKMKVFQRRNPASRPQPESCLRFQPRGLPYRRGRAGPNGLNQRLRSLCPVGLRIRGSRTHSSSPGSKLYFLRGYPWLPCPVGRSARVAPALEACRPYFFSAFPKRAGRSTTPRHQPALGSVSDVGRVQVHAGRPANTPFHTRDWRSV